MLYKVYDTRNKTFVKGDDFIFKPNGRLAVNVYGDEIGCTDYIPIFFPKDEDDRFHYDEIGGFHDSGTGTNPDGEFCGECSFISCSLCSEWKNNQMEK